MVGVFKIWCLVNDELYMEMMMWEKLNLWKSQLICGGTRWIISFTYTIYEMLRIANNN